MISRLLEQLDNPRRHLTLLVGVLGLVFVLTAAVAWRAHVAERDRGRIARSTLDETAAIALRDWNLFFTDYSGAMLLGLAKPVARRDASLLSMTDSIPIDRVCPDCGTPTPIRSAFRLSPAGQILESSGDPVDARLGLAIEERLTVDEVTQFQNDVHGGLYFFDIGEYVVPTAVFRVYRREQDAPRIIGVVLDTAMVREMLNLAYSRIRLLPQTLAPGATEEQLFARFAGTRSRNLIAQGESTEAGVIVSEGPVYGLVLSVGPQASAAALLQFGANPMAERATVVMLMLVISALMVLALMQVRREAELTRLRADFVSGVSHELRTPLAQIRMFTETLLLGRVRSDVERRRSLEIIDQEARRLAHLVENVLLFAKTEGGRRPRVAPEATNFAGEIRQSVESFTLLSRNRQVEVRTELQENIIVAVDRAALRQILINLVDNALKYGPAGQRITVGAALFDDVARLWVDDEGAGIPIEERAHVFDSFYRMPRDVESRVTGSGIGLAVVRELARLHGGDAWAEAAPGRGARIVVQFPDAYLRSEQAGDFAAAS